MWGWLVHLGMSLVVMSGDDNKFLASQKRQESSQTKATIGHVLQTSRCPRMAAAAQLSIGETPRALLIRSRLWRSLNNPTTPV